MSSLYRQTTTPAKRYRPISYVAPKGLSTYKAAATIQRSLQRYKNTQRLLRKAKRNAAGHGEMSFVRSVSSNTRDTVSGAASANLLITNAQNGGFSINGGVSAPYLTMYFTLLGVTLQTYSNAGAAVSTVTQGLPSVAEFVALYQDFSIDWIEIDFYFSAISTALGGGAGYNVPMIGYVKDYSDANYTSLPVMQQDDTYQVWQLGTNSAEGFRHRIRIKPRVNFSVTSSTYNVPTGTAQLPNVKWLSTDQSQTTPYYGLKFAVDNFFPEQSVGGTSIGYIGWNAKYHLSFKNTK